MLIPNRFVKYIVTTLGLLIAQTTVGAPVEVKVYGERAKDKVTYHYELINNSDEPLLLFEIGTTYDPENDEPIPQLGKLPVDASFGREGEVGQEILLEDESTTQPRGWMPMVYGPGLVTLRWYIPRDNKGLTAPIGPGESLSGFSVTLPVGDESALLLPLPPGSQSAFYLGGFRAVFPPPSQNYYGGIEVIDKTPPTIDIRATPEVIWPANGKMIPITVLVNVNDDYDKQPIIRLESVTAKEPISSSDITGAAIGSDDRSFELRARRSGDGKGRAYSITYSATDAVGNSARMTTVVAVPHDVRK